MTDGDTLKVARQGRGRHKVAIYKGGIGKTTTAIHVAAYMQTLAPTILADGDIVRASSKWAGVQRRYGLSFNVTRRDAG
jgi:cellulose biosynthesis protein BcsQ